MKSLHQTIKGIMALLLAMSLTACLTPFGDVPGVDTTNTTNTNTGGTTTGGGVSCDFTSGNSMYLTQCTTYSPSSGVTSCSSGTTAVSSCTGTYHCVYNSTFTIYYGGTDAAIAQTTCANAGGTWY